MSMTRLLLATSLLAGCNPPPSQDLLDQTRGGRLDVFFNEPGTRAENLWEPDAEDVMVDIINQTDATLDFAVMGFTRQRVIDAFLRAWDRGVAMRMVGDSGHLYNRGYMQLDNRQVPMAVGNQAHIMHDKFLVSDDRFVFAGTANWSDTDLRYNSNNFFLIDSPPIAADFTAEFEQMFNGSFGHTKVEIDNGRTYRVGPCNPDEDLDHPSNTECTEIEVWFSPNEDSMGRILEIVDAAEESIRFTIFAFTKDQVGSSFIRKQEEFAQKDAADGISPDADFRERRTVAGVVDQSQLHSNGQYHEAYRLLAAGIELRLDGNDNSQQPGDYQAGGGRLHSKTMVIDAYGDNPTVISGSFNWSSSATLSNDEFLIVMKGARIAQTYDDYFERLYHNGRDMGSEYVGDTVQPGDVLISEVQWYGVNPAWPTHWGDDEGLDEFIELHNTTDRTLDLSMWQIRNESDFVVGLPPGSVVPPGGYFLILDHTLEPYIDGVPQDELSVYNGGNLVVNSFNDNRQSRLYLKDGSLTLVLQDPRAQVMDRCGDGGAAFVGGPGGGVVRSMERNATPGDGTKGENWHASTVNEGGSHVNEPFRRVIRATPGEPNSN